jgi:hypothetical protein
VFFSFLGCAALGTTEEIRSAMPNREKIDPALWVEMESGRSDRSGREIGLLIRTKKEIDAAERGEIEKRNGKIGSVIGDIVTARAPIDAVPAIAGLDFVVYIEKAKRMRLR